MEVACHLARVLQHPSPVKVDLCIFSHSLLRVLWAASPHTNEELWCCVMTRGGQGFLLAIIKLQKIRFHM